jgi:hypothetical protein
VVAIEKLTDYALNLTHPVGEHKARVFRAVLGITQEHAEWLRNTLHDVAKNSENAVLRQRKSFGDQYEIVFSLQGPNGNVSEVTSGWQIDTGTDFPRLTTCYIRL